MRGLFDGIVTLALAYGAIAGLFGAIIGYQTGQFSWWEVLIVLVVSGLLADAALKK